MKELFSPPWSPEVIDQRLQQLTNGRWLRSWQRRGDKEIHQPLIDEIDQSGVNRHLISRVIPPETLKQLVQRSINSDSLIVPTKAATGILGRELPIDLYPRCISGAHPGF
ncbi:hypothetical protein, partial [Deinococcus fonticola]|uniref:hypothetical protein n=1 Tax=Deinococcus fonticola TaxID=2528713 RepID=UPI00197AC4B3